MSNKLNKIFINSQEKISKIIIQRELMNSPSKKCRVDGNNDSLVVITPDKTTDNDDVFSDKEQNDVK